MQEVRVCRNCKKLFTYQGYGPSLCPQCSAEDDKLFKKVRNYIYNHPNAKLADTAEACGVKPSLIQQWCQDERLQYSSLNATGLFCKTCGKPIRCGEYCEKCQEIQIRKLNMIKSGLSHKNPDNGSMHFLNRK